jgi:hypothetical protein
MCTRRRKYGQFPEIRSNKVKIQYNNLKRNSSYKVEAFHNLYSSPSIIRMIKSRRMRLAGHVERMGENRNAYRILVGKPEGKRLLERRRKY